MELVDFTDPSPHSESDTTALALAFSFSRSVWLTGIFPPRLARPALFPLPGSLSLDGGGMEEVFTLRVPMSIVLLTGRPPGRAPTSDSALDLAGRGRLRYWMLLRALGDRKPCSEFDTSRLVFLPPPTAGLMPGMPEDLGILPTVAEPPEMAVPPAVITVAVPVVGMGFL